MVDAPPRKPDETREPFMSGLATLPVFFKLHGKKVVLVGGEEGAAWKAELLQAAGADLHVIAPNPCARLVELETHASGVTLARREWAPADLDGATLALGDMETEAEALKFQAAARARGIPMNIIDKPKFCDFQFGSIVDRSPLVIAISTDGAAPVFGQAVRAKIETLIPNGFRGWAQAAKNWRPLVQAADLSFRARRRIWEHFTRAALDAPESKPDEAAFRALLTEEAALSPPTKGRVILVGAGPGDPELLTLKAVRALQSADVVLYDDLVSERTVEMARREARKIAVGKRGYKPSCGQNEITDLLIELGREGKRIVRLKGGDPMIFGRANEEILPLKAAGIEVEIIPGVTAASGAASSLGLSLTERDLARRVQFITAHSKDGTLPDDLEWAALIDPLASTAVYMGVRTLEPLSRRLLAEGIAPETPAILIERISWPDERHIAGTISDLPTKVREAAPKGPCLVLIGFTFKQQI